MSVWEPRLRTCWNSTLALSIMVVIGEAFSIKGSPAGFESIRLEHLNQLRMVHLIFALGVLIYLLMVRNTARWTKKVSSILFIFLMTPFGFFTWDYHQIMATSDSAWLPLPGFRIYFLVLGILFSGSYVVNFVLMSLFALESLVLWYSLDLGNLPSVVLAQEPWVSLLYFVIACALLFFRFRDEKLIQTLSDATANMAAMKQMARIFLSLRDRANTPIQTLRISAELLKRRYPDAKDLSLTIDATAKRLTEMNRYLGDVESAIPWGNKELISDAEVFQWIQKNSPLAKK